MSSETFSFALFSVLPAFGLAYFPHFLRVFLQSRVGKYSNSHPRSHVPATGLLHRLACAHANQLETLALYAAGVAAAAARGRGDALTDAWAKVYVGARAAYIVTYAAPQVADGMLRSVCFVISMAAIVGVWLRAAL